MSIRLSACISSGGTASVLLMWYHGCTANADLSRYQYRSSMPGSDPGMGTSVGEAVGPDRDASGCTTREGRETAGSMWVRVELPIQS